MKKHYISILRVCLMFLIFLTYSTHAEAQKKKKNATPTPPAVVEAPKPPAKDSTPVKKPSPAPANAPKAFKDLITPKAVSKNGLFTIHKVEEKYYLELPDSILNREIMCVTRVAKTSNGAGYGGELAKQEVVVFQKAPENKIFLRVNSYLNRTSDTAQFIYKAVQNSNITPIVEAFDIKAFGKDSTSNLIDVSEFFKSDNILLTLSPAMKKMYVINAWSKERSYIESIRTYPINTEIRAIKTYSASVPDGPPNPNAPPVRPLQAAADAGSVTFEFNTSFILLPKTPMRARNFDPRVGFFATGYTAFDDESQRTDDKSIIVRWRLEPKPEDIDKMKKGELVEPIKPIVYYIDPATPKQWRPFLKKGVEDWQKAFEQAGFKNAIIAKDWDENNPDMSLEDARFSVIRYFASDIQNAYGPNVHDPRSGEILESHIGWYHNVMSLVHNWYLIQTAAVDPKARKNKFDDDLMGELIRFVAAHEVGHTIGLRHNWGSSFAVPVEKLRDKAYIAKYSHTPSIMDYARFNYVAQPEDGITDLIPDVGVYDKWAIEWGYKPIFDTKNSDEDKKVLNKWILSHANDPMYWFGTEIHPADPRSQNEDLGNNAMLASEYGIRNLKRILPNLPTWTKEEASLFENLEEMYDALFGQFRRYMGHVAKNVGGIYDTPKSVEQNGVVFEPVSKNTQREAVTFLNKQLFDTPQWLLDQSILSKIRPGVGLEQMRVLQEGVLSNLLKNNRLQRISENSALSPSSNYTLDDLYGDLKNGIFAELKTHKAIDNFRRNLQKTFVEKLIALSAKDQRPAAPRFSYFAIKDVPSPNIKSSDIMSISKAYLNKIQSEAKTALAAGVSDNMSKYHLQDLVQRITTALEDK